MTRRDHRDLAALLLAKATTDAVAVEELLESDRVTDEIVGFHAHQACEKALKSVLAAHEVRYRYTHDLAELVDQIRDSVGPLPPELDEIVSLTPFAVAYRYEDVPIDEEPVDRQGLLALTSRVCRWAADHVRDDGS